MAPRLLITGSRAFSDAKVIRDALVDRFAPEILLVSGHADGADKLCEGAWEELGGRVERYPAEWKTHGRKAGLIRNERMAALPGIREALAFHLDSSRGTGHMINAARNNGIQVTVFGHSVEHDDFIAGTLFRSGKLADAQNYLRRCRIRHPSHVALWHQREAQVFHAIEKVNGQTTLFDFDEPRPFEPMSNRS